MELFIILGATIVIGLIIAIAEKKRNLDQHNAIINSNQNSDEIVKRLDIIINQQNYLIQLEQQKQSINYNQQNTQQNIPQNYDNSGFDNRQ